MLSGSVVSCMLEHANLSVLGAGFPTTPWAPTAEARGWTCLVPAGTIAPHQPPSAVWYQVPGSGGCGGAEARAGSPEFPASAALSPGLLGNGSTCGLGQTCLFVFEVPRL